jgi:hypothetical protein
MSKPGPVFFDDIKNLATKSVDGIVLSTTLINRSCLRKLFRSLKTRCAMVSQGVNAPRKRLVTGIGEGKFDTVLNIYAGGSMSYGAIGAKVALHRKAIVAITMTPAVNRID